MHRPRRPATVQRSFLVALCLSLAVAPLLLADDAEAKGRHRVRARLRGPIKGKAPKGSVLRWGRKPDAKHPLRQQLTPDALLKALLNIAEGGDLHQVPRHIRKALARLAKRPQRDLKKQKTQAHVMSLLKTMLGDTKYTTLVGTRVAGLRRAAEKLNKKRSIPDHEDMSRGWGWRLLPENDKTFNDPTFLTNMLRHTGQTGAGHFVDNYDPTAQRAFEDAWSKIAPRNTKPLAYVLTGSDANNLCYDYAAKAAESRLKKRVDNAEILFFDMAYAGGRGKMAELSFMAGGAKGKKGEYAITAPVSHHFKPKDKKEIARLSELESKALAQIEAKVQGSPRPIGGLLLESIIGAKGVLFYRPEFLLKVRALCDKLQVPIIADEILTGGGRTGKFFAYQHYKGFEPDLITFGKGLQVAGVARVDRSVGLVPHLKDMTTIKAHAEPMLKGAQILNRIRKDKLMDNARIVGEYFVKRLRAQEGDRYRKDDGPSRGMGMLIYTRVHVEARGAMGRLMPYLSYSKADVDKLLGRDHKLERATLRTDLQDLGTQVKAAKAAWSKATPDTFDQPFFNAYRQLEDAIGSAKQLEQKARGQGKLHGKVKTLLADAQRTSDRLHIEHAQRALDVWKVDRNAYDLVYAIRHSTQVLAAPHGTLSAAQKTKATKIAIAAYRSFVADAVRTTRRSFAVGNLSKVRDELYRLNKRQQTFSNERRAKEWFATLSKTDPKAHGELGRSIQRAGVMYTKLLTKFNRLQARQQKERARAAAARAQTAPEAKAKEPKPPAPQPAKKSFLRSLFGNK